MTVLRIMPRMLAAGEKQCRLWFEHLLVCERTGCFPGYVESDVEWDDEEVELDWDEEAA